MTQDHKDALHKAVHAHLHHRQRITEEALKLAAEIAAAQQGQMAVHPDGDTQGTENKTNA